MNLQDLFDILKTTVRDWLDDEAPRYAAALAYYTVLSLAPLLLVVISIATLFVGRDAVTGQLSSQLANVVSGQAATQIEEIIASASLQGAGVWGTIIGLATALFAATGFFSQIQAALNAMWEVEPDPSQGIMGTLKDRLLSFTMILGIAFLLLVSLIVNALLASIGDILTGLAPGAELLINVLNFIITIAVITLLFAAIFKVLPDVRIAWRDVWVGALVTALLFQLGQYALAWYLGQSSAGAAYGAASSLVALLLWVYYSSQILLLGAEFTQVYARHYGSHIVPAEGAVWAPGASKPGPKEGRPFPLPPPRQVALTSPVVASPTRRRLPAERQAEAGRNGLSGVLVAVASFVAGLFVGARR